MKTLTFVGVRSGDYECECYDVSLEEFVRLEGRKPQPRDRSYFNDGLYRYYPRLVETKDATYRVTISHEPIGPPPVKTPNGNQWGDWDKPTPDEDEDYS